MISSILQIISGLFWAAGKLYEVLYARKLVDVGRTQEQLATLQREIQNAQIAVEAREAVRASLVKHPNSIVPTDDPFLRD